MSNPIYGNVVGGGGSSTIKEEIQGYLENFKTETKLYTDNAVAQKSQVQIITWEADD